MNLEIISNINMDSLKFYMKEHTFIENCSYGNYMLDLVDSSSSIYTSQSEFVILFLDLDELAHPIDEVVQAIKQFATQSNKTLILNTLCAYPLYLDTYLHNSFQTELEANSALLNLAQNYTNILLFDFAKLIKQANFFDEKYWYMGRIKFSKVGFEAIANEIEGLINTFRYGSKKVLVLDMDNTLWGGVIAEDEIQLSNDGIGKIFLDFQKKIKKLSRLGVLLALCSKNNYNDAIEGLQHQNSVLSEDDFIVKKINWQDKATNIQEIASELNLGVDSFVFIDDNPVERNLVKTMLPDVTVPEFPQDLYHLNSWFLKIVNRYFAKITLTPEDQKKQEQYLAKIQRESYAQDLSYEEFLSSLEIHIDFLIDDPSHIERYAQMTQKTNQFNLTTKRYTTTEITNFIQSDTHTVIAISYADKFANEGITGLVIVDYSKDDVVIDTLLLSCRILKRGVEDAIFHKLDEIYPTRNIIGTYIPTAKNLQTKDLYATHGFTRIDDNRFIKRRT